MFYRGREMRRLWEVEVFDGEPEDDTPTHFETVVAWNAVDAINRCAAHVAKMPEEICFVTWPDDEDKIYRIDSTAGPSTEVIEPSVGDTGDWAF